MEGLRLVTEALKSSELVIQIFATREFTESRYWTNLTPLIEQNNVDLVAITSVQAEQLSETRSPQGIFALMPLPDYDEIPPLKGPLLILDNLVKLYRLNPRRAAPGAVWVAMGAE